MVADRRNLVEFFGDGPLNFLSESVPASAHQHRLRGDRS